MILLSATLLILVSIYVNNNSWRKPNHRDNIIGYAILLTLVVGLRTRYTGTPDTNIYSIMFENIGYSGSFEQFYDSQRRATDVFLLSERGFFFFTWLLAKISTNPQILIFTTSAINVLCAFFFIQKNSEDKEISFMGFICLGALTFSMNGMRQSLAMSICLLSYEFVKKRKLIPFLITVLIAVLFHKTAVVFLIVYFVYGLKWNAFGISVVAGSLVGFFVFVNDLAVFFDDITESNYAGGNTVEGGGFVTLIIYAVCVISVLLKKNTLKTDKNICCAFIMSVLGMAIYSARYFSIHIYERISYYFFFFVLILLAYVPKDTKYGKLLKEGILLLSFLLFVYRIWGGAFRDFTLFFMS